MAAGTEPTPRSWALPPIHWSAVIAGALVALASRVTLDLVGAAAGFATTRADSPGLGAVTALWALLVPIVTALAGAWLAVKLSGDAREGTAYAHGVLVWALVLVVTARFFTVGAAISGAAALGALLGLGAALFGAALARRAADPGAGRGWGRKAAEREVGAPGAFPPAPGSVPHPPGRTGGRDPREPLHH